MTDDQKIRGRPDREERRAERLRMLRSGPPSPCISVCTIDDKTGWCLGCARTLGEIRDWLIMTPEQKEHLLGELDLRQGRRRAGTV
ncbi:MAG: DUF1289 domain-containing protein [Rhodospirillaceae bacterium]|nr:DUF1289 domain-containing protein [Rhodospirillaceae bacterium]